MFIVILTYKKSIEEIEKNLSEHIQFLDKYYENSKFMISGHRNPRNGGVIIVNSDIQEEVNEIIREDPFYKNDLADYEMIEFIPTKANEYLSKFIR